MCWLLAMPMAMLMQAPAHAADIDVVQAHLEPSEDGYRLSATFSFDLNRRLEEALTHTIPLYFTTDVEISRPRWYWFDERAIMVSKTIRIEYNVLTRQYRAGVAGNVQQSFSTLDDALLLLRRPNRWIVADRAALKPGEVYNVTVRMRLNPEFLPKPFQVNALNNSDWRFASDTKTFTFRAE